MTSSFQVACGRSVVRAVLLMCSLMLSALPGHAALPSQLGDGTPLPSLAPMIERTSPAVVNIATMTRVRDYNPLLNDPFFRRFFNVPEGARGQERQTSSAGSGVIVDARLGYVLTNHHVIARADEIRVTLTDGRTLTAEVIGSDEQVDIALLQIPAEQLTAIALADAQPQVGDFVVAIGNPFGLGQTVTSGIVSALGRSGLGIHNYEDFIQTDASINPGNSGGALVNLRGELVGINSAILAPSGGNIGIGFAIPTEIATNVMNQLVQFGEVRRGQLGVLFQDLTPDLAEAFGLGNRRGAVIAEVRPDSPAARAGFKAGDIVVSVNGRPVKDARDLRNRIGLTLVGQPLKADILRDGRSLQLEAQVEAATAQSVSGEQIHRELAGVTLLDLIDNSTGAPRGVQVSKLDARSKAAKAGLREKDEVVAANRWRIRSVRDLQTIAQRADDLLLRVQRGNQSFYLVIR